MTKKLNFFSAIAFLTKYMKQYKKHFGMFYVGWFVDSILTIITPILLGIMIDEIVYYQNIESFIKISVLFFICILFSGGLYFLLYAQHGYLMNMFVFSIRKDIFAHLQKCSAQYLNNISTGEILAILQRYPEECMHFIIRNIIHTLNGIILVVLYAVYLMTTDWRIGAVALLTAFLSVFVNTKFEGEIRRQGDEERECYGRYISWMYEVITALSNIRLLGAKEKVEIIFDESQRKLLKIGERTGVITLTAEKLMTFINLSVKLMVYALAAVGAVKGNMTLGTMTVVLGFYEKMAEKISITSTRYLDSHTRIAYIQRIFDFLHTPSEQGGAKKLNIIKGDVCFNNVAFGYEKEEMLIKGITLKIHSGEKVAFVGKSGCGKTTLAHLLIGFYKPQVGEIIVDGQSLAESNLESIRCGIGLVQQDVLVFDGTIRQNLLMGNYHADEKQMLDACQAAGLGELIASLEKGIDTVIGSQGIGLSGGQKQRIAIARITLKNPSIVILDEATSALDSETEEAIHQVWKKTLKDKTTIIIAHRLSSVMLCDKVVILEDGKIVEQGTPNMLTTLSERFRKLYAIKED